MSLKNRVVIVTGASSGIGSATAKRLASDGFFVLIIYNSNLEGALECKAAIDKNNGSCEIAQFNVTDRGKTENVLDAFFDKHEELVLHGLVNNAGITLDTLTGLMSDDQFHKVIETNLYGSFYLMRWAVKKMLLKKTGIIVNMSSLSGQIGNGGQINYAASKAGIIAMTKSLCNEVGRRGIRVNAIAPGIIDTEMVHSVAFLDEIKKNIPLRRSGTAKEVASVVSFLFSDDSTYITGQTISVNGGLYCQ
jgi:3-oxoacyl-[acyl-carrier protein] reductase